MYNKLVPEPTKSKIHFPKDI